MVTQNDLGDPDTGPNSVQNFPTVLSASVNAGNVSVNAVLHSLANTTYTVDFYDNIALNASGYGEGKYYLGNATVTTDANGFASFTNSFPVLASSTALITLTATDPSNSTSEFSGPFGDPLPVSFLGVNLHKQAEGILVEWSVAREEGLNYYQIESSEDGINYIVAGKVQAAGSSYNEYQYLNTSKGNYYRIRAIDFDKTETLSPVRYISNHAELSFAIYPNPCNDYFDVLSTTGEYSIKIIDLQGKELYSGMVNDGLNKRFYHNLMPGLYIILLQTDISYRNIPVTIR